MENMQAFVLDVFCSDSATGNPAAVCVLTAWPEDLMLQTFAAAQSAPVTVFILLPPAPATAQPIPVRWFAGRQEINLCGHGSLAAAAFVLSQRPKWQQVVLTSMFGDISVARSPLSLAALSAGHDSFVMCLPAWPAQRPAELEAVDRIFVIVGAGSSAERLFCHAGLSFSAGKRRAGTGLCAGFYRAAATTALPRHHSDRAALCRRLARLLSATCCVILRPTSVSTKIWRLVRRNVHWHLIGCNALVRSTTAGTATIQ